MKQFWEILFHIIFCAILPTALLFFTVMTPPLCFPEGQKTADYLFHFALGCIPSWLFVIFGQILIKLELVTRYFFRKAMRAHMVAVLGLFLLCTVFGLMTEMKAVNWLTVSLITLCCLFPHLVRLIANRLRKQKRNAEAFSSTEKRETDSRKLPFGNR